MKAFIATVEHNQIERDGKRADGSTNRLCVFTVEIVTVDRQDGTCHCNGRRNRYLPLPVSVGPLAPVHHRSVRNHCLTGCPAGK